MISKMPLCQTAISSLTLSYWEVLHFSLHWNLQFVEFKVNSNLFFFSGMKGERGELSAPVVSLIHFHLELHCSGREMAHAIFCS